MRLHSSKLVCLLAALLGGTLLFGFPNPVIQEQPSANTRVQLLSKVGIDQKLNQPLPLEASFKDERGRDVRLGDYFHGKPVVLALVYYQCPMLCNLVLNGVVSSLAKLTLEPAKDYEFVAVSFDPSDNPKLAFAKKENYLEKYNRKGALEGFHFLTGKPDAIQAVTSAAGFRYSWDAASKQFAHASGIMIVTPEGRLSRYFYGIEYPERDLRLGLVEASHNRIGSPVDQVLLYCYHYDPVNGKYGFVIQNVIRVMGAATALALGTFLIVMFRRDRRGHNGVATWTSS